MKFLAELRNISRQLIIKILIWPRYLVVLIPWNRLRCNYLFSKETEGMTENLFEGPKSAARPLSQVKQSNIFQPSSSIPSSIKGEKITRLLLLYPVSDIQVTLHTSEWYPGHFTLHKRIKAVKLKRYMPMVVTWLWVTLNPI